MRHMMILAGALFLGVALRGIAADEPVTEAEKKAVAAIKEAAGELLGLDFDAMRPEKPVIGVSLYDKPVTPEIVKHLKELKHLRIIRLWHTKVAPGALTGLKGLASLEEIELNTDDTGFYKDDLAQLKQLRRLRLPFSVVTDEILAGLAPLENLEVLTLSWSPFTDKGLAALKKLPKLKTLQIDLKKSDATGEGFKSLVAIERISLVMEKNHDSILQNLAGWKQLRSLRVRSWGDRSMKPETLKAIAGLKGLENLHVGYSFSDAELKQLGGLKNLQTLSLSTSKLSAASAGTLGSFKKLRDLSLGPAPNEQLVGALRELPELRALGINGRGISDKALEALSGLTKLEELTLSDEGFTDARMKYLMPLANLRVLELPFTKITDEALKDIPDFKKLERFLCGFTPTTEAGRTALQRAMPKLKIMNYAVQAPYF